MNYFHLAFSITQECPFLCDICLRHYDTNSRILNPDQWRQMINILKPIGLKRLTITGGEPLILGEKLFDFLKFMHQQKIHTSLSTTGFRLTERIVKEADSYLDHILISVRSLDQGNWVTDFGNTPFTEDLFENAKRMLKWAKNTQIILEVNSVVHQENKNRIIELGWKLLEINSSITWRVENYYATGLTIDSRNRFEVGDQEFDEICFAVDKEFSGKFRNIRYVPKTIKESTPGYVLMQNGDLILVSEHAHESLGYNVLMNKLPKEFPMPRPWFHYKEISRDWGWNDFVGV